MGIDILRNIILKRVLEFISSQQVTNAAIELAFRHNRVVSGIMIYFSQHLKSNWWYKKQNNILTPVQYIPRKKQFALNQRKTIDFNHSLKKKTTMVNVINESPNCISCNMHLIASSTVYLSAALRWCTLWYQETTQMYMMFNQHKTFYQLLYVTIYVPATNWPHTRKHMNVFQCT